MEFGEKFVKHTKNKTVSVIFEFHKTSLVRAISVQSLKLFLAQF